MLRRHRLLVQRLLVYHDLGLVFLCYALSIRMRFWLERHQPLFLEGHTFRLEPGSQLLLVAVAVACLAFLYRILGLYRSQRLVGLAAELGHIVLANALALLTLLALAFALQLPATNRFQLGCFALLNVVGMAASRVSIRGIARWMRMRGYNFRNLLVATGSGRGVAEILRRVRQHPDWGLRVVALLAPPKARETLEEPEMKAALAAVGGPPVLEPLAADAFMDRVPVDEVWVDGLPEVGPLADVVLSASDRGARLRFVLPADLVPGSRWGFESLEHLSILTATHTPLGDLAQVTKRFLDFWLSLLLLLLASPIMLLAAVLIRLEDRGPAFFRQERVGRNGRLFTMCKFRTMVPDAERRRHELEAANEMQGPVFKLRRDPRVTRVGRWLRKFSIDELPQLWNVVKGDMSLVGPRPPLPGEVNLYERRQRKRLSVKPGITGLWQVSGRNELQDFESWVKLDLEYIENWSLGLDLRILLKTIPAVLLARGAR